MLPRLLVVRLLLRARLLLKWLRPWLMLELRWLLRLLICVKSGGLGALACRLPPLLTGHPRRG